MAYKDVSKIPLVDLRAQYSSIKNEIDECIRSVLDHSSFVGGNRLSEFEKMFAFFCGVKHCIGVGNGTDALFIGLKCLGIGAGDEVVTVPNTFFATAEAIALTGARPVFVDVDESTYNLDPIRLESLLERRKRGGSTVKAIVPVHLYGRPCPMEEILDIAEQYGVDVIEDAAQGHGATIRCSGSGSLSDTNGASAAGGWKRAGAMGAMGCFSFYPGKNLGAYGDGGAIITNDDRLAGIMRMFANHGRLDKYHHEILGVNSRLDALQAAILTVKLRHLEEWTERRRRIAGMYTEFIAREIGLDKVVPPEEDPTGGHVYHLYVVRVPNRDRIRLDLNQHGISTGIHYPVPLHLTNAFSPMGHEAGAFPVSEKIAREVLSLPLYPELTDDQIFRVCDTLASVL